MKNKKITKDYRLIGLSRPSSATLELLHTDEETIWASIKMSKKKIDALWKHCDGNWSIRKYAVVECDAINEHGLPINPVMIGLRHWDVL